MPSKPPKRNSFDQQHELLESAKQMLSIVDLYQADPNGRPVGGPYGPAILRLKAAVAECEAHQ